MSRHAQGNKDKSSAATGKQPAANVKDPKKAAVTKPAASAARQADKSTGFKSLMMNQDAGGDAAPESPGTSSSQLSGGGGSSSARGNDRDHGGNHGGGGGSAGGADAARGGDGGGGQKRPASGAPERAAGVKRVRAPSPQSQASEADKSVVQAAKVWVRLTANAQTLARMLEQLGTTPTSSVALRVKNFLPRALKLVSQLYPRLHAEGFHFLSKTKGGNERSLPDTVVNVLEKHTDFRLEYFSELNDDGEAPKITIFFNSVLHVVSGVGAGGSECWEVRG
jgi:hypothetical protein